MKKLLVFAFLVQVLFPAIGFSAPAVLYFAVDKPVIYPEKWIDESVVITFSLIAAEKDDQKKIAGAVLIDPVKNAPYGTFQATDNQGGYQLMLTHKQVIEMRGHDPLSADEREFTAVVYNSEGESTESSLRISFVKPYEFKLTSEIPKDIFSQASITIGPMEKTVNGKLVRGQLIRSKSNLSMNMLNKTSFAKTPVDESCKVAQLIRGDNVPQTTFQYKDADQCQRAYEIFQPLCESYKGLTPVASEKIQSDWYVRTLTCSDRSLYYFSFIVNGVAIEHYTGLVK